MIGGARSPLSNLQLTSVVAFALIICLFFFLTVRNSPAPTIDIEFGDTTIFIGADRAWTLYPGDCVNLRWQLEGIESLYIDGAGKIGADDMRFCPDINVTSPLIEVRAQNGIYRRFKLDIQHLPDLLFYLVGFVTLVGSPTLAVYYFWLRQLERPMPVYWLLLGGLVLTVLGAWLRLTPYEAPLIDEVEGNVAIRIWADHDRSLFPHECVKVWWSAVGARSIRFNGGEAPLDSNPANADHCAEDGESARIEVVNEYGKSATYRLAIASLFPHRTVPPPFVYWSLFGMVLSLLIFVPLLLRIVQERWRREARTDALAIAGCFFVVFVLYLPFGFDSSGQWEEWIIHGYTEGGTLSFYVTEAVSRPWVMVPHTLAYLISSESFIGYHLVNFLQYAGRMALLYVILRQLGVLPLYAFLTTILFMVYPVNDALMTLRRLPKNFSVLTLLLSAALFLDYCRNPRRLTLLGIWLGLLFSVNSNETGYAVILIVPLLLWLRDRRFTWRNLNLSAIWYVVPAFKLASVVLLLATGRDFYQSGLLGAGADAREPTATVIDTIVEVLGIVYPQTFVGGWQEALATLFANLWWLPTMIILAGVGIIAKFFIRKTVDERLPSVRQICLSLAAGLLLIIAAVGVLMWVPLYRNDPWRMYLLVPIGAAISAFSLVLLLASPIRDAVRHKGTVAAICMLLTAPAVSRLFLQHNGFVDSAESKARILYQVLEIVPELERNTQLVIVTEFDNAELRERGIQELLRNDMLNSAMHALYQEGAPEYAYFCHSLNQCGDFSGDETIFSSEAPADLLQRTLVFLLNDDHTVELVEDPAMVLGLDVDAPYEASRLYDAEAPLPPRAGTMLAAAARS